MGSNSAAARVSGFDLRPGALNYGLIDARGNLDHAAIAVANVAIAAELAAAGGNDRFPVDDDELEEGEDLGAELLVDDVDFPDGNGGSFAGLEFIGDVGRDPFPDYGVND